MLYMSNQIKFKEFVIGWLHSFMFGRPSLSRPTADIYRLQLRMGIPSKLHVGLISGGRCREYVFVAVELTSRMFDSDEGRDPFSTLSSSQSHSSAASRVAFKTRKGRKTPTPRFILPRCLYVMM